MMTLWVIILSVIQGITEFLPISSSAHLFLTPWIFNFPDPGLAFDAAIHIGTALALLVFFGREFWKMFVDKDKLLWYILIASVPAAILGFLGDSLIDKYLHQSSYAPLIIGIGIAFFAVVLYIVDKTAKLDEGIEQFSLKQSLIVGFAQALALVPGTSRSGITITAGLWLGLKREDAARFSFLLATPISLGAGAYKLQQLLRHPQHNLSNLNIFLGILVSFVVGVIVIAWFLKYLKKHTMTIFVVYRIILGLFVVGLWFYRK